MNQKTRNLIIFFIFIIHVPFGNTCNIFAQQIQQKTIAVLPFEVREGLSKTAAATLSDRLRSELVNLEKYTVLERGQMHSILQEQGFTQTGCTTSECAVEAGRLLGVQTMVAGLVGKVGELLTIDIRVFDVETGKILQAHQTDYDGEVSGLLAVMSDIAGKISEVEDDKEFPWLWMSVGVVVVGTGVAAVILSGDKESGGQSQQILPGAEGIWPPR